MRVQNRPQMPDFIGEDVPSVQIVFGSMLIVAWVMSDPVNCELMGRPVMQKEMTYSVTVVLDLIAFCP